MVCSTLNDDEIQTCAQGVYDWWPSITEALFKYQGTGDVICVGACQCRGSSCGVKRILKQVSRAFLQKRPSHPQLKYVIPIMLITLCTRNVVSMYFDLWIMAIFNWQCKYQHREWNQWRVPILVRSFSDTKRNHG